MRFEDDKRLWTTVLYRELVDLGFRASYQTLTREIRVRQLRPVCVECMGARRNAATIEIDHPPGEEMQFDWLKLTQTPWGSPAAVLVGALSPFVEVPRRVLRWADHRAPRRVA